MSDVVVTVPKNFRHPCAPGLKGLAAWLAEGDAPGEPWSGVLWWFTTYGGRPKIEPGERVYVVCEGRLVGYSPLHKLLVDGREVVFIRAGGAVAVTIDLPIVGFRGWRYRWWDRSDEKSLDLSSLVNTKESRRSAGLTAASRKAEQETGILKHRADEFWDNENPDDYTADL